MFKTELRFSWIKRGKKATMQNSFWFLGAEGRFQEIKQTISFGNSPKSGAFWPQSRGEQLLREVGSPFTFPKGSRPGLRGVGRRVPERRPVSSRAELSPVLFPPGSLGWKLARGWGWGTALTWPFPREAGGPLVDPDLLVGNACSKGSYSAVYLALSKGRV